MIPLNQNYDQIKKQIDYIKNHILDCKTPNEAANYQAIYKSLVYLYYILKKEIYQDKKINRNHFASYAGTRKNNELFLKYHQNYLKNKSFHYEMFSYSLKYLSDIWNTYLESDEYQNLSTTYQRPINEKKGEDIDILKQYFLEKDPSLLDIFKTLQEQESIYCCLDDTFLNQRAFTILNYVENKANIFVSKNNYCNIAYLGSIVHELAHVKDFFDLYQRSSPKVQQMYFSKSSFPEVISTEYEIDFYQFLINNNIHKKEGQKVLATTYNSYLDSLEDACLYASLEDEYHLLAVNNTLTRNEVIKLINPSNIETEETGEELLSDFNESLEYSYGLLFHPILSNNQKVKDQFMMIRHDYFNKETLNSIGMSHKEVISYAKENAKTYFKC